MGLKRERGRVEGTARALDLLFLVLLAVATASGTQAADLAPRARTRPQASLTSAPADRPAPMGTIPSAQKAGASSMAAFSAVRHPDTVSEQGPYRATVRQLSGAEITGGRAIYSVSDPTGRKVAEGQVELRSGEADSTWVAGIPGQPIGSTVTYHYEFTTRVGALLRHPAAPSTTYRFRVVGLQLASLTLPAGDAATGRSAVLQVSAASPPSGELVTCPLPASPGPSQEQTTVLEVQKRPGDDPFAFEMKAELPRILPGGLVDFYFRLRTAGGAELKVPADAPARLYSLKNPLRLIQPLPGEGGFVLGAGTFGQQRWIGLKGAGVWVQEAGGSESRWGLADGLPSQVVRFVLPDAASGRVYLGTDGGVVAIDPVGHSPVAVAPSVYPSAWGAEQPIAARLGQARKAGPGALSSLDGTLLFQLQAEQVMEEVAPAALFMQLRDDRLSEWRPLTTPTLVGLSSATFDGVDGCWLLGGFVLRAEHELGSAVVRQCGESWEQVVLPSFVVGSLRARPERVVALARDPSTGGLVLGLEYTVEGAPQQQKGFGVYRLDKTTGQLSPLAPETAAMSSEVTSLATDWPRARILVGTFGQGLLSVQGGAVQRLGPEPGLPSEVTTVEMDNESGSVLVGTSRGALELSAEGTWGRLGGQRGDGPILTRALPMDVEPETGRVLLSSYAEGLFELGRGADGRWRPVESLQAGRELPGGLFGEARYTAADEISVILHSQGLLEVKGSRTTLLTPANGLHSQHLLQLLAVGQGEVWLAFTPMPSGTGVSGALQILRNSHVIRTVEIANREVATIGRWIEVPERESVFAATRAGVVEIHQDGSIARLSQYSASSIARDPRTGSIWAAGATVERWDGERFVPVLFQVDHPRWPRGRFQAGTPIDLALDGDGNCYLLFKNGILLLLNGSGEFVGLLTPEDGVPPTASRLLVHPVYGDVFVGAGSEAPAVVLATSSVAQPDRRAGDADRPIRP